MSSFEDYIKNRPNHLNQLIEWGLEDETKDRFEFISRSKKQRILNALKETKHYDLYEKIKLCYSTKRKRYRSGSGACKNVYCPSCRDLQAYLHQSNIRARIKEAQVELSIIKNQDVFLSETRTFIDSLQEPTNEDHLHITGYLGLTEPTVEAVKAKIKEDTNNWNKIRHNINKTKDKPLWIEVAYEFELVNWRYLRLAPASDYKKTQVEQMRQSQSITKDQSIFIHFHGMTNIHKEDLKCAFKDYYFFDQKPLIKTHQDTGLYVQSLHKSKPLFTNVQKLSSYPFKQAMRFKHSWIGSDHRTGEPFTSEELSLMIKLYDELQGAKLFRSVTNGAKPWSRLSFIINQILTKAKDDKSLRNHDLIKQCLPHLTIIQSSILKTRNAPERLARCVKAMKALAVIYVDYPDYLTNKTEQWFIKSYEALYYIIRNLSHSYVRSTTVQRSIEQLTKQRSKQLSSLRGS